MSSQLFLCFSQYNIKVSFGNLFILLVLVLFEMYNLLRTRSKYQKNIQYDIITHNIPSLCTRYSEAVLHIVQLLEILDS